MRFFPIVRVLISIAVATAIPRLVAAQVEVKDAWLKRNCLDKGTGDHPTSPSEFEACLRKLTEPLPPLDQSRREFFGEKYDPAKYVECRTRPGNRTNSACNVYILRRREWPEYWPDGAKRIKWPAAPKQSVYRNGMKPKEYWEALCKAEAGEFVVTRILNVEGFYYARPRGYVTDQELGDRYVLEDPLTLTDALGGAEIANEFVQPYLGRYRFLETHKNRGVIRFFRIEQSRSPRKYQTMIDGRGVWIPYIVQAESIERSSTRFAISWRGIGRPLDREHGIAGSEVVVSDMRSGEVLALRRGFAFVDFAKARSRLPWMSALRCPDDRGAPTRQFVYDVLKPLADVNANIKRLEN